MVLDGENTFRSLISAPQQIFGLGIFIAVVQIYQWCRPSLSDAAIKFNIIP